ncbi:MAG: hypothetical protein HC853_05855 [Anaerolineae bacterium]|nr:hypothetical protein [Anaerolineae bacterium]
MKTATVNKLRKYRQQCERDTDNSAHRIRVPLMHVLADVCKTLQLSPKQRKRVLGHQGTIKLEDMRAWRVTLNSPRQAK